MVYSWTLYFAVIDGDAPELWRPWNLLTLPEIIKDWMPPAEKVPIPPHVKGECEIDLSISLLPFNDLIKETNLAPFFGCLVDATDLSSERDRQIRTMFLKLLNVLPMRRPELYARFGFHLWFVRKNEQRTQVTSDIVAQFQSDLYQDAWTKLSHDPRITLERQSLFNQIHLKNHAETLLENAYIQFGLFGAP